MTAVDEDLSPLLRAEVAFTNDGFTAQATGTGPTVRPSAVTEVMASVINVARHDLVVTTPYYVPDEFLHGALCGCSRRGVATTLIVPARNDSQLVAFASRSYYEELLEAGVRIFEFAPGLLHAKTMIADSEVALIGSANLDRRSFELNYENNILLVDRVTAAALRRRQREYIASSREITIDEVRRWPAYRRFMNNAVAMFSPLL
jgi:cardiolipin synthase